MRISSFICLFFIMCTSCNRAKYDHQGKTPLVELNGNFLYQEDLQRALPQGLTTDDSLTFAKHYIRNWIEDLLLFDKAQQNIEDNAEIENRVRNYRQSLVAHTYQQMLIRQQLTEEITEKDLLDYYTKNAEVFKAESPWVKGLFIKIPLASPKLNQVRQWYKSERQESIENLEKYSLQHAVKYEYFHDRWLPISDILDWLPLKEPNIGTFLEKNRHIELKDSVFWYFLNISEYIRSGEQEPYEAARPRVKDMLLNMRQVEFMDRVKADLYQQAVKDNEIKYFMN